MVRVPDSGSSVPGSGPGWGHWVVFLGKDTLLPRFLTPPRCINGYRRNAGDNPAMDWHPIQGRVKKYSYSLHALKGNRVTLHL